MLQKIQSLLKRDGCRRLLSNVVALYCLQVVSYVLPLMTMPYIFNVLGPSLFGKVMYAQGVMAYFLLVVNYGFNLSGTREVSLCKHDIGKLTDIFWRVTYVKSFFSLIIVVFIFLYYFLFEVEYSEFILYFLTFGMVVESIVFPVWFYQGMERMKYISIIFSLSKVVVAVLVFIFIEEPSDYLLVPALYLASSLVSGAVSIYVIFFRFGVGFTALRVKDVFSEICQNWQLFLSNALANVNRNMNVVILGLVGDSQLVGYYALAEKVIRAIQSMLAPVGQALFPFMSEKSSKVSQKELSESIFSISRYYMAVSLLMVASVWMFSPLFVSYLAGNGEGNLLLDIKILSCLVLFGPVSYLFGVVGLVNLGLKRYYTQCLLMSVVLNFLISFVLGPLFFDVGMAVSVVISEIVLFLMLLKKILSLSSTLNER